MEADKDTMNEKILNLTMEIICLLIGEDYTVVKSIFGNVIPSSCSSVSGGWGRTQSPNLKPPPHSLIHENRNKQKILELTNKIIELLTGEVPIRCQDVTVHFSIKEWEYLEGHKDLYEDILMEDHQPLISPVGFASKDENEELDTCAPSLSYLKDGEINGNVQGIAEESNSYSMEEVAFTTITRYPSIIIEEKPPCDRRNLTKSNDPVHDVAMCGSLHFVKEPCTCNEENAANQNIYTLMEQTPQYTSTHIKEEPSSCDGGNLTNPNIYTPIDHTQQHSTTCIKEQKATSDEDLTDPNSYTITDHDQYIFTDIKKEPILNESETLTDHNICIPTDHTQYQSFHIKEEPDSCHGENLIEPNTYRFTDNTKQYPTTDIKAEQALCDDSLKDTNSYTPTDHAQQYSTTDVKEEQALCEEDLTDNNTKGREEAALTAAEVEKIVYHLYSIVQRKQSGMQRFGLQSSLYQAFITDNNSSTTTDHTKYLFSRVNKEPVSSNKVNLTDLNIHATVDSRQQYGYTDITTKPDFHDGGNLTNPNSTSSTEHTQQYRTKEEPVLEEMSALQKHECFSPGKTVEKKNKEPEQNYNDISISSNKYFCTIQQTTHSLEILYNCPECPECFTSNLDLAKHQIIHTGGMPFICSVCGRCFRRKSDLIIHQVTHGGSTDFGCPQCDLSFATMSSLCIHEKTHLQKKPLPCPECGKTFLNKKRLTAHRHTHIDERPFKCPECGDTFKRKAQVQRHQTVHEKARQQLTSTETF